MTDGEGDHLLDLGHALEQGKTPGGSEHIDGILGEALTQGFEQALGHDHVPDPGRTHDQQTFGDLVRTSGGHSSIGMEPIEPLRERLDRPWYERSVVPGID